MIDEYKVGTCDDCPMRRNIDDARGIGVVCEHPQVGDEDDITRLLGGPPPGWCPLRKMPMRIALEET